MKIQMLMENREELRQSLFYTLDNIYTYDLIYPYSRFRRNIVESEINESMNYLILMPWCLFIFLGNRTLGSLFLA